MLKTMMRPLAALAIALATALSANAAEINWKFYTYFGANDKPTELHKAFASADI